MARKYRRRHRANPSGNRRHGIGKRLNRLKVNIAYKLFGLGVPIDSHIDNGLTCANRIRPQRTGMTRSSYDDIRPTAHFC